MLTVSARLRRAALGFLLASPVLIAQGWQGLPNTKLQSICPPNGFQPVGGGMPAYNFADNCHGIVEDWGGAAVDTKRNRMLLWGGGHVSYRGNEVYALELGTLSTSYKARTNSAAPSMVRLTDPSIFHTDCTPNDDGTPQAVHSYGGLVYLPKADKMFHWFGSSTYCGTRDAGLAIYLFNLTTNTWEKPAVVYPSDGDPYTGAGAHCVLDLTVEDESVTCFVGNNDLVRYNAATNVLTRLTKYNSRVVQYAPSLVIDPDRKMLFSFGTSYTGEESTGRLYAIDMTSASYTLTDWTSTVSGCENLIQYPFPSVTWDPSLHRIVGYVPRESGTTTSSNQVLIFDPGTRACVTQPIAGGPTAAVGIVGVEAAHGMFARFAYFPDIGKYALISSGNGDAYTFSLNLTPTHGLGASSITCVDRDGDRFGTGPGCTGPDADDQDSNVYTAAQFLSKWSTVAAGLAHLGYAPSNIWYVATDGNDSTGAVNNPDLPFATCCGSGKANPAAGDAVLLRGGTYSFRAYSAKSGSSGSPIIYMSYPGELAVFDTYPSGFGFLDVDYFVLDGMRFASNGSNAGVSAGLNTNAIVRHIDSSRNEWGLVASDIQDFTIEDSVFHDNSGSGAQHGIYLASHSASTPSRNVFVRRNLLYNNDYTGFQFNGQVANLVVEQNISYSNLLSGFAFLTGVQSSRFLDNVAFNNGQAGLTIYNYTDFCTAYDPGGVGKTCPYDQHNNVIENFTVYNTGKDRNGGGSIAAQAAIKVVNGSLNKVGDLGHNTFRNIVASVPAVGNQYQPIVFVDTDKDYLGTSVFDHILFNQLDTGRGTGSAVIGFGNSENFGYNPYSCTEASSATTMTNCINADPKFISASVSYWNAPASFDLRLQSSSPAVRRGTSVDAPTYDLLGNLFAKPPSMGAYESVSADTTSRSACDINRDGIVNILDIQAAINQALGVMPCGTADLLLSGECSVIGVQRVIIATLGGACVTGN